MLPKCKKVSPHYMTFESPFITYQSTGGDTISSFPFPYIPERQKTSLNIPPIIAEERWRVNVHIIFIIYADTGCMSGLRYKNRPMTGKSGRMAAAMPQICFAPNHCFNFKQRFLHSQFISQATQLSLGKFITLTLSLQRLSQFAQRALLISSRAR